MTRMLLTRAGATPSNVARMSRTLATVRAAMPIVGGSTPAWPASRGDHARPAGEHSHRPGQDFLGGAVADGQPGAPPAHLDAQAPRKSRR